MEAPERGDLAWLSFTPHAGREQAGRRPALILSPKSYNRRIGLALACPITSRIKGYPFEVIISGVAGLEGVVLADHVRSVDWRARRVDPIARAPEVLVSEVLARLCPLLET
ncbi:MAG TPA: type II toxin-antitoxin system PemK/MazF family toxin [Geminicoccaceae bacterium]